jgi:hypothetical protein
MESHPEEFKLEDPSYHDRWYNHMSAINTYGNETDKAALAAKVRDIRMGVIHEQVMDELLNGEDRRRKEEEDREYERHLAHASRQGLVQQQKAYVSQLHGMANQLYGGGGGAGAALQGYQNAAGAQGIVGKSYTSAIMDEYDTDLERREREGKSPMELYGNYGSILPVANGGTGSTITNTINQIKRRLGKGK